MAALATPQGKDFRSPLRIEAECSCRRADLFPAPDFTTVPMAVAGGIDNLLGTGTDRKKPTWCRPSRRFVPADSTCAAEMPPPITMPPPNTLPMPVIVSVSAGAAGANVLLAAGRNATKKCRPPETICLPPCLMERPRLAAGSNDLGAATDDPSVSPSRPTAPLASHEQRAAVGEPALNCVPPLIRAPESVPCASITSIPWRE